jgi:antitoxin (DNA-binding transcriptional repressor) of toxin-antitoxin stability system
MKNANIQEAQSHLLQLIESALGGEEVIISQGGHPLVRLVSCQEILKPRVPGFWQGQVKIAEDFDDSIEEITAAFYGEEA